MDCLYESIDRTQGKMSDTKGENSPGKNADDTSLQNGSAYFSDDLRGDATWKGRGLQVSVLKADCQVCGNYFVLGKHTVLPLCQNGKGGAVCQGLVEQYLQQSKAGNLLVFVSVSGIFTLASFASEDSFRDEGSGLQVFIWS